MLMIGIGSNKQTAYALLGDSLAASGNDADGGVLFTLEAGDDKAARFHIWRLSVASRNALTLKIEADVSETETENWIELYNAALVLATDSYSNANYVWNGNIPFIGARSYRVTGTGSDIDWAVQGQKRW